MHLVKESEKSSSSEGFRPIRSWAAPLLEGCCGSMRWRILIVRAVLGVLFAFLLARFFFPTIGSLTTLIIAALLVFFAYLLESVHQKRE
jgi:hypothetical protein